MEVNLAPSPTELSPQVEAALDLPILPGGPAWATPRVFIRAAKAAEVFLSCVEILDLDTPAGHELLSALWDAGYDPDLERIEFEDIVGLEDRVREYEQTRKV